MQGFLDIALGFPTVLWSVLLTLVSLYWLSVVLGALDLELLDIDIDFPEDIDIDLDVDADVDVDADGDVSTAGANPLLKVAVALGIGKVPVTILLTFLSIAGWAASYFGVVFLAPMLKFGAVGAVILGISFVLAVPAMGVMAHPLKKVFAMRTRDAGSTIIGEVCVISTGSVNGTFGQARLENEGAGLLLNVRCESKNNGLKKGSPALIIGHDRERDVYFIEPYEQFLATEGDDMAVMEAAEAEVEELVNAKREA